MIGASGGTAAAAARHGALIAGVDEVGRGPLAGPVVAAAVILDPADPISGIDDSKRLSAPRRRALASEIRRRALAWSIVPCSAAEVDRLNIRRATLEAMRRAVRQLPLAPALVLVDGNVVPQALGVAARCMVGGDALEPAIGAASILAKVWRDAWMTALDRRYPVYGFARHKGYGTREHLSALRWYGPCPEHRRSFTPVQRVLTQQPLPLDPTEDG